MKILALDSSQSLQSFAVYDTAKQDFILKKSFPGKSSEIIEKLKTDFLETKLKLKEIDLLAVNLGPGSFTGIRNALCIVKTLALELKLPIFICNSFELMRFEKGFNTETAISLPAFKNNFFVSLDSDYSSLKTNFFSALETGIPVYNFSCENLSELLINFLLSISIIKELETALNKDTPLFDPNKLRPYYLREPSVGKKELCR